MTPAHPVRVTSGRARGCDDRAHGHRGSPPVSRGACGARQGRARRGARSSHADCEPSPTAPTRSTLLEAQADDPGARSSCRSATGGCSPRRSPSTAARRAIMAADLARRPRSGLTVQLCGDAHLSNFGVFASPERRLVFDINDFDETLPGPWEWDVKRLAASSLIAGRDNGFSAQGPGPDRARRRSSAYRDRDARVRGDAQPRRLVRPRSTSRRCSQQLARRRSTASASQRVAKHWPRPARSDSLQALAKLTAGRGRRAADRRRPAADRADRRAAPTRDPRTLEDELRGLLRGYRTTLAPDRRQLLERYESSTWRARSSASAASAPALDRAARSAATTTTRCSCRSRRPSPRCSSRTSGRASSRNHGQRVVDGQRLMQAASDIFLGWQRVDRARRRVARLLRPPAAGLEGLGGHRGDGRRRRWLAYGALCGWTLARAHARSRRPDRDRGLPRRRRRVRPGAASSSPSATPTRTSATTRRWQAAVDSGGSSRRPDSDVFFTARR